MSDRGRPHNIGQALFESLGAGLGAYGSLLEQERIRKSETQQQSFLNRLRIESGERAQTSLEQGQERIGISREQLERQKRADFLRQQEGFFGAFQDLTIDPIEQSQIDLRTVREAEIRKRTELLGTGGGRSMFGVSTGGTIFDELLGGFKQREFGRLVQAGDPRFTTADPETGVRTQRSDIDFGDISDFISTPEDTLRVLLQQAKGITGETPPLGDLGNDGVFPQIDFENLRGRSELRQRAIEFANADDPNWQNLPPEEQEAYLQFIENSKLR